MKKGKPTSAAASISEAISISIGAVIEPSSLLLSGPGSGVQAYQAPASHQHLEATVARLVSTELRRHTNIQEATREAVRLAGESPSDNPKPIHPDFAAEWIEGVKDVSDETVRAFWAHLLAQAPYTDAGRVEKPVVDFLKLLDRSLCRELKELYRSSRATGGTLFDELNAPSPMAEEVGLGEYVQRSYFKTEDETVAFVANVGAFRAFQLGERATRLGELVCPPPTEDTSLRHFYKALPDILRAIKISDTVSAFTLEVRDDRKHRNLFDLLIKVEKYKPNNYGNAAGVIKDTPLSRRRFSDELRAAITEISPILGYRGSEKIHTIPR